ncbi:hypothetical protein Nepgr_031075 [Nepenthes gracilis]|uniref:Uncharacterized protein n=1 Tax=Nepenthes gracilis TaxID=150966 RepID=A0AAD3Y4G8_NEPGR|nr:hypothetical protein Nepgr_031075 [Nepenthes gracilis]
MRLPPHTWFRLIGRFHLNFIVGSPVKSLTSGAWSSWITTNKWEANIREGRPSGLVRTVAKTSRWTLLLDRCQRTSDFTKLRSDHLGKIENLLPAIFPVKQHVLRSGYAFARGNPHR